MKSSFLDKALGGLRQILEALGVLLVFGWMANFLGQSWFFGAFLGLLAVSVAYYAWWLRTHRSEEMRLVAQGELRRNRAGLDEFDRKRAGMVGLVPVLFMFLALFFVPTMPALLISLISGVLFALLLYEFTKPL